MNKNEIYNQLLSINTVVDQFRNQGVVSKVSADDVQKVQRVWKAIYPAADVNSLMSCSSCLRDVISIMISLQERLKKELNPEPVKDNIPAEVEDQVKEVVEVETTAEEVKEVPTVSKKKYPKKK